MRASRVLLIATLALGLSSCAAAGQTTPASSTSVGFWFWRGSAVTADSADLPVDTIYFHAGDITQQDVGRHEWNAYSEIPEGLPHAEAYWMVLRYDRQKVPTAAALPLLAESLNSIAAEARQRQLPLAGVQLDIDAPTGSLHEYALFLRQLRKVMPKGMQLSITALLDWFRDGTDVAEVIDETDEFVPQFYDISDKNGGGGVVRLSQSQPSGIRPIAAKVDATIWAARFNRYNKRYRIGIASFGRAAVVLAGSAQAYGDLMPLAISGDPAFTVATGRTSAREILLKYRASQRTRLSYISFDIGDSVEFVLPTADSVRDAFGNAKRMGPYCGGVVFFRWPLPDHEIALRPAQVLSAIGKYRENTASTRIATVDGGCAAVQCVDLHLLNVEALSTERVRYKITSSIPFEYFVSEKNISVRPVGPDTLELSIPPFPGTDHLYLGRAVTSSHAEFAVTKES